MLMDPDVPKSKNIRILKIQVQIQVIDRGKNNSKKSDGAKQLMYTAIRRKTNLVKNTVHTVQDNFCQDHKVGGEKKRGPKKSSQCFPNPVLRIWIR